ncbi:TRICHOME BIREFRINGENCE-LIKE 6 [Artemisia annua]|uniref:TRICHOME BIREFRINGENCE-LIKE 6 n=1 Tax=Artemisia annua TaxID=35608 RepID=A0A2U1KJI7_ARTAN|nr:TRICHOME BIREFRINGENCE-LIKE 6 [Artemisia annua]
MCQHEVKVAWVTMCHGSKGAEQDRVNYYQEADNVLPHLDSSTTFTKSMITWASWVEKNINPRSSAPSHSKGGESNDGGQLVIVKKPHSPSTKPQPPTIVKKQISFSNAS